MLAIHGKESKTKAAVIVAAVAFLMLASASLIIASDDSEAADGEYTLTIQVMGGKGGTVTGAGTYDAGQVVTVTAIAKHGYAFKTWSDGNTNANRIVTMDSDKQLTATFVNYSSSDLADTDNYIILAAAVAIAATACGVLLILLYWIVYRKDKADKSE